MAVQSDAEQAIRQIVAEISGMDRQTVMVAAAAVQAGWLSDAERAALAGLSKALDALSVSYGTSVQTGDE